MQRHTLAVCLLLLTACGGPIRIEPFFHEDISIEDVMPIIEEAEEILNHPISLEEPGEAPIVVEFVDAVDAEYDGMYFEISRCHHLVRTEFDSEVLAHEIAHAHGLDHLDVPGNLMHPHYEGTQLNGDQYETLLDGIDRLAACP